MGLESEGGWGGTLSLPLPSLVEANLCYRHLSQLVALPRGLGQLTPNQQSAGGAGQSPHNKGVGLCCVLGALSFPDWGLGGG